MGAINPRNDSDVDITIGRNAVSAGSKNTNVLNAVEIIAEERRVHFVHALSAMASNGAVAFARGFLESDLMICCMKHED